MKRTTLKWLLLMPGLIACGVLVAFLVMVVNDHGDAWWMPSWRWFTFGVYTAILFGSLAAEYRIYWNVRMFWIAMLAFFVVRFVPYTVVLTAAEEWRPVWFFPLILAEHAVFTLLLARLDIHWRPTARPFRRRETGTK